MSKTAHTPGPWHWRDDVNGGEYDLAPGVLTTNLTDGTPWGDEHDRANARLIAAAPDMLEALKNVNKLISEAAMTGFNWKDGDWPDRLFNSQQKTSRAISKAELNPMTATVGNAAQPVERAERLAAQARSVQKWLDGGCSSWGVPEQAIRALAAALEATASPKAVVTDALIEKYAKTFYGRIAVPDSVVQLHFKEFADEVLSAALPLTAPPAPERAQQDEAPELLNHFWADADGVEMIRIDGWDYNLNAVRKAISVNRPVASPARGEVAVKVLEEWHEDIGPVLWWKFPIEEQPYVGTPLDLGFTVEAHTTTRIISQVNQDHDPEPKIERIDVGGWPGYHTHWSLIPTPALASAEPATATGGE